MFRVFGMVVLNRLSSLNYSEYYGNYGYDQQDMYQSPGTVANKTNEPANDQNDSYYIK